MEHHVIDYGEYMPHGMCLLWQPWLVLLWAGSDLLIFLSYTAIPVALFMVLRRRTEVPQPALVVLFAAFILLCGITHLFMIVTLWVPIYPFVGWLKLATGLVSIATAVMLFRLIPDIVRLPSPAALETVNRGLHEEIAAHKATLASLDLQVRERTADLERATTALAVQAREAVHRSSNLLSVVHTLAMQSAKGSRSLADFLDPFLGRVRALADATRSMGADGDARARLSAVVEAALAVPRATYGDRIAYSGPPIEIGQIAAQQLSLALHELATNTHKYGLGVSDGLRVSVTWSTAGEDFTLLWREQCGAAASPAAAAEQPVEGFGSTLLMSIVPATLRGKAERSFDADGMTYRLVAPLAAIRDRLSPDEEADLASRIIAASFSNE